MNNPLDQLLKWEHEVLYRNYVLLENPTASVLENFYRIDMFAKRLKDVINASLAFQMNDLT